MRKKRITVSRGSLSPFTAAAIIQLMQEFNRKEDAPQCLVLAKAFQDKAMRLKKEPCRQPSKAKKRTEADKLKRAEAFAKIKAGAYIPVAVRQHYQPPVALQERQEASQQQGEHVWSLQEYEAWIHQPVAAKPPQATPASPQPLPAVLTQSERDYLARLAVSREVGKEKNEAGWDD